MVVENPATPTVAEANLTRTWLTNRGITVDWPTRLLAVRIGSREQARRSYQFYGVLLGFAWAVAVVPHFPVPLKFLLVGAVFTGYPALQWRRVRSREHVAARLAPGGARPSWRVAAGQVGWWYLVSVATTFGGGAVLCAARFLSSPAAGACWAVALAIGAFGAALVLGPALRAPVIAEDETSLAVDGILRAQDAAVFAPSAVLVVLAWIDWSVTWPAAPPWFPVRVGYIVLAIATWAVARFGARYRRLPPGTYGTETASGGRHLGRPPDLSGSTPA